MPVYAVVAGEVTGDCPASKVPQLAGGVECVRGQRRVRLPKPWHAPVLLPASIQF